MLIFNGIICENPISPWSNFVPHLRRSSPLYLPIPTLRSGLLNDASSRLHFAMLSILLSLDTLQVLSSGAKRRHLIATAARPWYAAPHEMSAEGAEHCSHISNFGIRVVSLPDLAAWPSRSRTIPVAPSPVLCANPTALPASRRSNRSLGTSRRHHHEAGVDELTGPMRFTFIRIISSRSAFV